MSVPDELPVLPRLRAEILTGALLPGDAVNEVEIAERFGVSPTPVREAVWQLISEGYIEGGGNRRRRVTRLSPQRAIEVVELMGVLIPAALEQAGKWAPGVELDELADRADAMVNQLEQHQPDAVIAAATEFVQDLGRACRQRQLARVLDETAQRAGSLVLFPADVWSPWSGWSWQMSRIGNALRERQLRLAATSYRELMMEFADRMRHLLPEVSDAEAEAVAPPSVSGPTRQENVIEHIRGEIVRGNLRPGDPVRETEIARRLGVSSTPVREAIRILMVAGIIEGKPHQPRRVTVLSTDDMRELIGVFRILQAWLLPQALSAMSPEEVAEFTATADRAADVFDADAPGDQSPSVFALYELLGRFGGNGELIAMLNNTLLRTTPYWSLIDTGPYQRYLRKLAAIGYPNRGAEALAALDELNVEAPRGGRLITPES